MINPFYSENGHTRYVFNNKTPTQPPSDKLLSEGFSEKKPFGFDSYTANKFVPM